MPMAKECKLPYCHNPVFSHSYCKAHQYLRQDSKKPRPLARSTKRIQPVSDHRKAQMITYTSDKAKALEEARKSGTLRCFVCGKDIHRDIIPDIHHLDGREEDRLTDSRYQCWVHRKCHTEIHDLPVGILLTRGWYEGYLQRLKSVDEKLYDKEYEKRYKTIIGWTGEDTTI